MIALVDYGAGNLQSVANMLIKIGVEFTVVDNGVQLGRASKIIVPGVGNFGQMCAELDARSFRNQLISSIEDGVPYFGICLGMQILFEASEESPGAKGLGVLKGTAKRFSTAERVPHMGWNALSHAGLSTPGKAFSDGEYVYFAHSYFCPIGPETVAITEHGHPICAAVERENVSGVQFHPEKSGQIGEKFLRAFVGVVC